MLTHSPLAIHDTTHNSTHNSTQVYPVQVQVVHELTNYDSLLPVVGYSSI